MINMFFKNKKKNKLTKTLETKNEVISCKLNNVQEINSIIEEWNKKNSILVLDISKLEYEYKKRVLDFINGYLFAVKGSIENISTDKYRIAKKIV